MENGEWRIISNTPTRMDLHSPFSILHSQFSILNSVSRLAFFQPIAVLAAARYGGAATTYSLLSPKSKEPKNTPNPLKHDTTRDGFVSVCSVCSVVKKNGIATQSQDHLPNRVGLLHQFVDHFARHELVDLHRTLLRLYFAEWILIGDLPVDCIVHELASELDPFMDRRRGHP